MSEILTLANQGLKCLDPIYKDASSIILDYNEFTQLAQLAFMSNLQKLSIANNKIGDMHDISKLTNLTILNLAYNNISIIDGLRPLSQLTWINLSGNRIRTIDNLSYNTSLKHLDLSENEITHLGDLSKLTKLKTLLLHCNNITLLDTASKYIPNQICILSIAENQINNITEFAKLSHIKNLFQFGCQGNPCTHNINVNHRPYILCLFPGLQTLDGSTVEYADRRKGTWLWNNGITKQFESHESDRLLQYLRNTELPYPNHPISSGSQWNHQDTFLRRHSNDEHDQSGGDQCANLHGAQLDRSPLSRHLINGRQNVTETNNNTSQWVNGLPSHWFQNGFEHCQGPAILHTPLSSSSIPPIYQSQQSWTNSPGSFASTSIQSVGNIKQPSRMLSSNEQSSIISSIVGNTSLSTSLLQSDSIFLPINTSDTSLCSPRRSSVRKSLLPSESCTLVDCCLSPAPEDNEKNKEELCELPCTTIHVKLDDDTKSASSIAEKKPVAYVTHHSLTADSSLKSPPTAQTTPLSHSKPLLNNVYSEPLSVELRKYSINNLQNLSSEIGHRNFVSMGDQNCNNTSLSTDWLVRRTGDKNTVQSNSSTNCIEIPETLSDGTIRTTNNGNFLNMDTNLANNSVCPICGCNSTVVNKALTSLQVHIHALREAATADMKSRQLHSQAMQFLLKEVESLKEWKFSVVSSGILSDPSSRQPQLVEENTNASSVKAIKSGNQDNMQVNSLLPQAEAIINPSTPQQSKGLPIVSNLKSFNSSTKMAQVLDESSPIVDYTDSQAVIKHDLNDNKLLNNEITEILNNCQLSEKDILPSSSLAAEVEKVYEEVFAGISNQQSNCSATLTGSLPNMINDASNSDLDQLVAINAKTKTESCSLLSDAQPV